MLVRTYQRRRKGAGDGSPVSKSASPVGRRSRQDCDATNSTRTLGTESEPQYDAFELDPEREEAMMRLADSCPPCFENSLLPEDEGKDRAIKKPVKRYRVEEDSTEIAGKLKAERHSQPVSNLNGLASKHSPLSRSPEPAKRSQKIQLTGRVENAQQAMAVHDSSTTITSSDACHASISISCRLPPQPSRDDHPSIHKPGPTRTALSRQLLHHPQANAHKAPRFADHSASILPPGSQPPPRLGGALEPPVIPRPMVTATLLEATENGEAMAAVDEAVFAIDGMKEGQPVRVCRVSAGSLAVLLASRAKRRLLRARGLLKGVLRAACGAPTWDPALAFCVAALLYHLATDDEDVALADSNECFMCLVKLLTSLPLLEDNAPATGSKTVGAAGVAAMLNRVMESFSGADANSPQPDPASADGCVPRSSQDSQTGARGTAYAHVGGSTTTKSGAPDPFAMHAGPGDREDAADDDVFDFGAELKKKGNQGTWQGSKKPSRDAGIRAGGLSDLHTARPGVDGAGSNNYNNHGHESEKGGSRALESSEPQGLLLGALRAYDTHEDSHSVLPGERPSTATLALLTAEKLSSSRVHVGLARGGGGSGRRLQGNGWAEGDGTPKRPECSVRDRLRTTGALDEIVRLACDSLAASIPTPRQSSSALKLSSAAPSSFPAKSAPGPLQPATSSSSSSAAAAAAQTLSSVPSSSLADLERELRLVRCLRVLENATFLNDDNQAYLIQKTLPNARLASAATNHKTDAAPATVIGDSKAHGKGQGHSCGVTMTSNSAPTQAPGLVGSSSLPAAPPPGGPPTFLAVVLDAIRTRATHAGLTGDGCQLRKHCVMSAMKVLMNLTNENAASCRAVCEQGGLEAIGGILAACLAPQASGKDLPPEPQQPGQQQQPEGQHMLGSSLEKQQGGAEAHGGMRQGQEAGMSDMSNDRPMSSQDDDMMMSAPPSGISRTRLRPARHKVNHSTTNHNAGTNNATIAGTGHSPGGSQKSHSRGPARRVLDARAGGGDGQSGPEGVGAGRQGVAGGQDDGTAPPVALVSSDLLDVVVVAVGVLVNLAEKDEATRTALLNMQLPAGADAGISPQAPRRSLLEVLCHLFRRGHAQAVEHLRRMSTGSDDAPGWDGQGQGISEAQQNSRGPGLGGQGYAGHGLEGEDLSELEQSKAESMWVEAYAALLLAFLAKAGYVAALQKWWGLGKASMYELFI
eukprot:jgi/Mesvir1/27524/Mv07285-RA.2